MFDSEDNEWSEEDELVDILAISESKLKLFESKITFISSG